MQLYSFNVAWSKDDEVFVATCPEFPGLSAFGDSREEAVHEAGIALEGFIEVLSEEGKRLPTPELVRDYSGRFLTRVPKMLHARLAKLAEREGVSLNSLVLSFLSECVGGMEVIRRRERALDRRFEVLAEEVRRDLRLSMESSSGTEFQDSEDKFQKALQESQSIYG